MISILITLLIVCLIAGVAIWAIGLIPLPAPFGVIARVVVGVIVLIYLIQLLAGGVSGRIG
jgi:hypothetical protein